MATKLEDLNHIKEVSAEGYVVYVLDKGEVIDSEAEAMLQALHSRSTGGFESHLEILKEKGVRDFMSRFYVGYGHKSIGDCGSITIFIENVSMLCAKVIQDTKLYNGQEASTRYIDFSKQDFIDPSNSVLGKKILEEQRSFYLKAVERVKQHYKRQFQKEEGQNDVVYEKAINAATFDACRSFLPAGASTNLAWHTNLRQVADRIIILRNHPLKEIREVAKLIEVAVTKKYPNSFSAKKYEETENFTKEVMKNYYFHKKILQEVKLVSSSISKEEIENLKPILNARPNEKTEIPSSFVDNLGTLRFNFCLDFGSFRDIQRHRAVFQKMPLLTLELGFSDWYFKQIPQDFLEETKNYLESLEKKIESLNLIKEEKQYFIPMGYLISNDLLGTLSSLIYLVELRTTIHVHQTLRVVAKQLGEILEEEFKLKLFLDKTDKKFDLKRGEQDIVQK